MRHLQSVDLFRTLWPAALRSWGESDPALAAVAPSTPPSPPLAPMPTTFSALINAIVHQQFSLAAGNRISRRLTEACDGEITANRLLALSDDALRAFGIARIRAASIRAAARAQLQGSLCGLGQLSDDEAQVRLCAFSGVGPWTAQMVLIFHFNRLDIFAPSDLGLRQGILLLDKRAVRPSLAEAKDRALSWKPYRSLAALVLWDLVFSQTDCGPLRLPLIDNLDQEIQRGGEGLKPTFALGGRPSGVTRQLLKKSLQQVIVS